MDATRHAFLRILAVAVLVALAPACGSGGGSGGALPLFDTSGGTATGSALAGKTLGGGAGDISVSSCGDLRFGVNPPPAPPSLPPIPISGIQVTSADLTGGFFLRPSGNILIPGSVRSGDSTTQILNITAMNGDIVVSGNFQSGRNTTGGFNQTRSLFLSAPNGTVYITGKVRTSSDDGIADGTHSGEVNVSALKIVVTGGIDTHGEDGPSVGTALPPGNGGALTFDTLTGGGTDILMVGATLRSSGGSSNLSGGGAGNIRMEAGGALHFHGSISGSGGSMTGRADFATGGAGASLQTTTTTGIFVDGVIDLSGGDTNVNGGGSTGGAGGNLHVTQSNTGPAAFYGSIVLRGGAANDLDPRNLTTTAGAGGKVTIGLGGLTSNPSAVDFPRRSLVARGGSSDDTGGHGGDLSFECMGSAPGAIVFAVEADGSGGAGGNTGGEARTLVLATEHGDILLEGTYVLRGGDSGGTPGEAGSLSVDCGSGAASPSGNITLSATLEAEGGAGAGGNAVGGAGGSADLTTRGPGAFILLTVKSSLQMSGGSSSGTGAAGIGGEFFVETASGPVTLLGDVLVRGGRAPDSGGTGGLGGEIIVHSDGDNDGVGGDITVGAKALVDASGGDGTFGGDGLNSIGVAIDLDADGNNSNAGTNGRILNLGVIIARGGVSGGFGGDALFDGLNSVGAAGPDPFESGGLLDLRSDGGPSGSFTSQ